MTECRATAACVYPRKQRAMIGSRCGRSSARVGVRTRSTHALWAVFLYSLEYSVGVGMNIFLAFFLLLKLLASSTPSSSSIPLIGKFYSSTYLRNHIPELHNMSSVAVSRPSSGGVAIRFATLLVSRMTSCFCIMPRRLSNLLA